MATVSKAKLAVTTIAPAGHVSTSHLFNVKLTGDFEFDSFTIGGASQAEAQQNAIDEYLRRNGVSPASVDRITQLS